MAIHILRGCSPSPLANYLKALGILRLVGQQADCQARGWWDGDRFCLLTSLEKEELEKFFLERYQPTPIFNPWGGRSGFYGGSPEKTARSALAAIEVSKSPCLTNFRNAIRLIRHIIENAGGEKPDDEVSKEFMIKSIRLGLRDAGLDWLDTVLADLGDSFRGPAILGTGGNEGSGSYTAAFLAAIVECIIGASWNEKISASLWSDRADRNAWHGTFQPPPSETLKKPKRESVAGPFRQYLPSGTGSPWDLILAFEGAIVIQSGISIRASNARHRFVTSPFYFAPLGMGAGSSSDMDEYVLNKGKKNPGRGEQWFPMWETPSTFKEIQHLFREGRCSNRRKVAKNGLDAALAICCLGTNRGIRSFLRYGYLQRDNLATHFAVPLGRVYVRANKNARLVDDLSVWLDKLHKAARDKNATARLIQAERRLAEAVFAALTHDYTAQRWQSILLAASEMEALQATGSAIDAGPIPPLQPDWIEAIAEDSPEFRLALALGSAAAEYNRRGQPVDPIRHHFLPLEMGARRFKIADKRLVNDSRVVANSRDPIRDMSAIVERRLIEAAQQGQRRSRLKPAKGCGARPGDLAQFLNGSVDDGRMLALARALMAVTWAKWSPKHLPQTTTPPLSPDEPWLAMRLCCLPFAIDQAHDIPADERIVRLLISGNTTRAADIARQRLQSVGIRAPFQTSVTNSDVSMRWAAAMVFPIEIFTANRFCQKLDQSFKAIKQRKEKQNA